MKKTSLIFFGTPQFSAEILKGLIRGSYNIVAVVTQPDRPVGRRQILTSSPVKILAKKNKIPVLTPKNLDSQFLNSSISQFLPIDLAILAAYGKIIPKKLLLIPRFGFLNIHPSLLPKYRGPSPIETAILNGERETGVTIIQMDEKIDHGPIVSQAKIFIDETDTKCSLTKKLAKLASQLLLATLPHYYAFLTQPISSYPFLDAPRVRGKAKFFFPPKPQDHKKATYTKILTREDGFINPKDLQRALEGRLSRKAIEIERKIRAFDPWPGSWTEIKVKSQKSKVKTLRLKILKAHLLTQQAKPTTILVLDQVQLEGKKPVSFAELKRGYPDSKFF